jgi:hypothetical protein
MKTLESHTAHVMELDQLHSKITDGTFVGKKHVPQVGLALELSRAKCTPEEWKELINPLRLHPMIVATQQDPFTHRSFSRPRGYPGDAVLLDLIYRHESITPILDGASELGRQIYSYTSISPASIGVIERRNRLTETIDSKMREMKGRGKVLSIACGHLRELDGSQSANGFQIEEFVAIDQDPLTIEELSKGPERPWLKPKVASVRDLLTRSLFLGRYDIVYAAGLLDYLPDKICVKLLLCMRDLLAESGTLLVANYLDGIIDRGYMECCMDWWLTYRTEEDMYRLGIAAELNPVISVDQQRQLVYLEHHA